MGALSILLAIGSIIVAFGTLFKGIVTLIMACKKASGKKEDKA